MRLSIPIDSWDPDRGGAERYLHRLATELCARGHEVTVLCLETHESDRPRGLAVEVLRVPRFPRWVRELRFAEEALLVHRRSRSDILFAVRHALEADVYQPHGGALRAARRAGDLALGPLRRAGRRLAARLRPSTRLLLRLDREVFVRSPRLLTISVSRKVEEDFRRAYPSLRFRFERIHNPVDTERFHGRDRAERARLLRQRFGIPPGARIALFVAHRFRPKGLQHAIAALRSAPGWHLVFAGRERSAPFLRLAGRLGVHARTHCAGGVSDTRALYAGADALVLPTYYDPCSLAVLEAMACGTPAVTTRENGASELIEPGRTGFVVDAPGDEAALAQSLARIADGWASFHQALLEPRSGWGWGAHLERVEKVLSRALSGA